MATQPVPQPQPRPAAPILPEPLVPSARPLMAGDTVPWFRAPMLGGPDMVNFENLAGTPVLMLFLGSARWGPCRKALDQLAAHRALFDEERLRFIGVSCDPADRDGGAVRRSLPGVRWFLDDEGGVSRAFAACDGAPAAGYRPFWLLLDRTLRVVARAAIGETQAILARAAKLRAEPDPDIAAPVLTVPRLFPPELCRRLIDLYERQGGGESGFMRDVDGVTRGFVDHSFKKRSDTTIEDEGLKGEIRSRLARLLVPQIRLAYQFQVTRIERWIVACYDDEGPGGHFGAHRDNTTLGTAHRRFACTINLNAEAYDGGDLSFPEFGAQRFRAPTGGAVVFSCGLLHKVHPVTRGRRYAFLPFFYDDAAAAIRERNQAFLAKD